METDTVTLKELLRADSGKYHYVQCPHCTRSFSIDRVYRKILETAVDAVRNLKRKVRIAGVGTLQPGRTKNQLKLALSYTFTKTHRTETQNT